MRNRNEEQTCEEALLWIDEIMTGMEFPIARTTASVRENQELEAVIVTGLSDVAVDGRESWVGRLAAVVGRARCTRHYKGQPKSLQQRTNHKRKCEEQRKRKPLRLEKTFYRTKRENATLLELKAKPTKIGQNREKPYATRTPRHSTLTKLRVQRKHNVGTWPAHAPKRHTTGQESAFPMLTNNDKRYKRKRSHATALQSANTPPKNAKNTRDQSS